MTPFYQLIVSGQDITADVTGRAGIIEWSDTVEEGSDTLTITLQDTDNLLAVPKAGAKVELSAGYNGALQRVGSFTVESTEMEGPPDRLTVQSTSAPVAQAGSIANRRSKSWEDTTLGDVAQSIASSLSVELAIDPELAAIPITNEQQVDQSDTDFILRLVRRNGGYLKFADGRMIIAKEGSGTGTGGAVLNTTLQRSQVTRWRVQAGGKGQALKKVKVKYHDYETGETNEVEADVEAPASMPQLTDDVAWLAASESTFTPPAPAASEEHAKAVARTTAKRISRNTRRLQLALPGRLDIVAGGRVTLSGFREGVDGEWLVKTVQHRLDSRGWSMTVDGEGAA
jgi:phage protein D